ncbi:VOC family protein [Polyangium sorediatum]|uniref:VOC family protein n=1 Tax=Polyangium sorediatum TaxID=889274 RepID=A0ABT6P4V7_9BACT|nr:VOC family protein [Polyangium sorediatum]MDI1435556.1 VOC family protein [Polyangium sorediatum]
MKLGYVILYVQDVEAAVVFYERAFGLTRRFVHESNQYAEMETGATALAFVSESLAGSHGFSFRASRSTELAAAVELALTTPDVPAAFEVAVAAGAAAVSAPKTKPWGQTVAYVRDLDGFLVELCTPMG